MTSQRRKFTPEEDEKLRMLVAENGAQKWDMIAESMPGRTGRQCRDRYQNYLSPGISRDEWTEEEEKLLVEKYAEFGSHWSKISRFFQGRTGTALKNRWNYYVSRNSGKMPSSSEDPPSDDQGPSAGILSFKEAGALVDQIFGALKEEDFMEVAMFDYDPLCMFGHRPSTLCLY